MNVCIRVRVRRFKEPRSHLNPDWRVEQATQRLIVCRKDGSGEVVRFRRRDGRDVKRRRRIIPEDLLRIENTLTKL